MHQPIYELWHETDHSAAFFLLPGLADASEYRVAKVIDGDTIDILYKGRKERIRILCVNTPESVHPDRYKNSYMGWKASRFTKSRLSGKKAGLEFEKRKRGNYGRLLAYVIVDGENFNLELIRQGWSQYYTKYGASKKYHIRFKEAETSAKKEQLNIWSGLIDVGQQPFSILTPSFLMARGRNGLFWQENDKSHSCPHSSQRTRQW